MDFVSSQIASGVESKLAFAKETIGRDCVYEPDTIAKLLGVPLLQEQREELGQLHGISRETLTSARNDSVLVAACPLSILDLRCRARGLFDKDSFYAFEDDLVEKKSYWDWYLFPRRVPSLTLGNSYGAQIGFLNPNAHERVPDVHELTYIIFVHYLIHRRWLFSGHELRCANLTKVAGREGRIAVTVDGARNKILVRAIPDSLQLPNLGLVPSRR